MNNQTIKRAKKDWEHPYKSMPRALFEDDRISFEARGILGYILVKPDDWEVNLTDLMRKGKIGRDQTRRIMSELVNAGYIVKEYQRDDKGHFSRAVYVVHEEPQPLTEKQQSFDDSTQEPLTDLPYTGKPLTDYPLTENPPHTNKEVLTNKEKEQKKKTTTGSGANNCSSLPEKDPLVAEVYSTWQNNMPGTMSPIIADSIDDLIKTYGPVEVKSAIEVAVKSGVRNIKYVDGILRNRANGNDFVSRSNEKTKDGLSIVSQSGSGKIVQGDISMLNRRD